MCCLSGRQYQRTPACPAGAVIRMVDATSEIAIVEQVGDLAEVAT
jgi:hypothetical protein